MAEIARLSTADADFRARLDALLAWDSVSDDQVQQTVAEHHHRSVRTRGDAALLDYTARFDGWQPGCAADLEIPQRRPGPGLDAIPADQREALELAAARIRAYAEHQRLARLRATARRTAPCSASRSRRWTGSGSMSPAARRPIRPRS